MRIESSTESEAEREHEEDENDYEEDYERPPSSPAHVKIIKASARFVEEADGPEEQAQAQRERGGGGAGRAPALSGGTGRQAGAAGTWCHSPTGLRAPSLEA